MKGERRRVSCRDLGRGDCQGWLWKKKSGDDFGTNQRLTSKWAKRWVVIKDRAIYCYRNNSQEDDQRAECYIGLPGYTVTPATECKRKYAFRICHVKRKTFFFAAERQMDMSRWMNKMGLASIEYKYDGKQANGDNKTKDNDYYSESDDEIETTSVQENYEVASNSSYPVGANGAVTMTDGLNGDVRRRKMDRFHTTSELVGLNSSESPKIRKNSQSSKHSVESSSNQSASHSSISNKGDVTPGEVPPAENETLKDEENELSSNTASLSRSLNSLLVSDKPSKSLAASYQKAKDRASKWSTRIRRKTMTSAERMQIITDQSHSSCEDSPASSSTTPLITPKQKRSAPTRHLSINGLHQSLSAPALTAPNTSNDVQTTQEQQPQEEPQETQAANPDTEDPVVESNTAPLAEPSPPLSRVNLLHNMRQSIKKAEVDLLGANRRVTLRRKMTVLSSDPRTNERMLRKRALERELKAKELELAYFNQLLNKDKISHADLNAWMNQHPSLVAEIGTLRRLSNKNKRPPLDQSSLGIIPQEGNEESRDVSPLISANSNNNNSRNSPRGRPRSSAIGAADLGAAHFPDDPKSHTLPSKPESRRRKKLNPNRPFQTSSNANKPYLETDL